MNKLFFCLFFLSLQLFAKSSETVILLKEMGVSGKMLSKDVAIMIGESFMVNKEKLSASEIITHSEHITNIASFDKIKQTDKCASGTFIHLLKFNNYIKNEEGCLESNRFKSLKKSFKALQKKWIMVND